MCSKVLRESFEHKYSLAVLQALRLAARRLLTAFFGLAGPAAGLPAFFAALRAVVNEAAIACF